MNTQETSKNAETKPGGYTLLGTGLSCPECSNAMEQIDTTPNY